MNLLNLLHGVDFSREAVANAIEGVEMGNVIRNFYHRTILTLAFWSSATRDETRLVEDKFNIEEIVWRNSGHISTPPNEHYLYQRTVPEPYRMLGCTHCNTYDRRRHLYA